MKKRLIIATFLALIAIAAGIGTVRADDPVYFQATGPASTSTGNAELGKNELDFTNSEDTIDTGGDDDHIVLGSGRDAIFMDDSVEGESWTTSFPNPGDESDLLHMGDDNDAIHLGADSDAVVFDDSLLIAEGPNSNELALRSGVLVSSEWEGRASVLVNLDGWARMKSDLSGANVRVEANGDIVFQLGSD